MATITKDVLGTAFDERNNVPTVKQEGGSVMLWGWVAGTIAWADGRMDSTKHQQILKETEPKKKLLP